MSSTALMDLPWRNSSSGHESFFAAARERYRLHLDNCPRRSVEPVFNRYRFCNVFREDDRTTIWFRENVRQPLAEDAVGVLLSTMVFRWFNKIETGERILPMLQQGEWEPQFVRAKLAGVHPLVTGAYMIKTPAKMNKLDGIIWCIDAFVRDGMHYDIRHNLGDHYLQGVHEGLMQAPYLGPFMAYEVVTDLRHTCVLRDAPDINTWCNLGPGAARGLGWVMNGDPTLFNRHSTSDQQIMLEHCRGLLALAHTEEHWPHRWPRWEMREVEHFLCEYDKLQRGVRGERLKRRYP